MCKECKDLLEKIQSISKNATSNLQEELYPKTLGRSISVRVPEIRLTILSRFEGIALILRDIGANTKELEAMIETETNKTIEGKY